jgi:hypothetical protein
MEQVEDTALTHHGVVIEVLLQPLPQLHRQFIEGIIPGQQIIRADDRGIASGITGTNPALLQHSDASNTVYLGKIMRCRKSMPAATHDDHVIAALGLRVAPCWPPA